MQCHTKIVSYSRNNLWSFSIAFIWKRAIAKSPTKISPLEAQSIWTLTFLNLTFKLGIRSKSLSWGTYIGRFCVYFILGLLSQNSRCLYVQTQHLWMVVLVFPCYLPSRLPPPKLHHSSSHPMSSKIWVYFQMLLWDRWCQKYDLWQQCKSGPCQPSDCSPSLPVCYTELLPPHSSPSERWLGREVIAVKLL